MGLFLLIFPYLFLYQCLSFLVSHSIDSYSIDSFQAPVTLLQIGGHIEGKNQQFSLQ